MLGQKMSNILSVGIGGFIGAILRYLISGLTNKYLGPGFPYGILTVNILGSAAIGFFLAAV